MPISEERLAGILNKSKSLMNPQADKMMNQYTNSNSNNDNDYFAEKYGQVKENKRPQQTSQRSYVPGQMEQNYDTYEDDYADRFDSEFDNYNWGASTKSMGQESMVSEGNVNYENYSQDTASRSKMPDVIKQSMLNNRIDTSKLGNLSVVDQMPDSFKQKMMESSQRQANREKPVQTKQINKQTTGIDYDTLKSLMMECLDEYFSSKTGNLKTIGLSAGKIKLVDNKGNIYSATLEKKGNVNDKK